MGFRPRNLNNMCRAEKSSLPESFGDIPLKFDPLWKFHIAMEAMAHWTKVYHGLGLVLVRKTEDNHGGLKLQTQKRIHQLYWFHQIFSQSWYFPDIILPSSGSRLDLSQGRYWFHQRHQLRFWLPSEVEALALRQVKSHTPMHFSGCAS